MVSLQKKYEGGYIGIFRLCVDDYHRFHFIDDGIKSHERHINGVFHTVNPIANDVYPIYKENTREYCVHRTENFGDVIVMEVGALWLAELSIIWKSAGLKRELKKVILNMAVQQ